jgi:fructose/tagatose bisphosphate aldolase
MESMVRRAHISTMPGKSLGFPPRTIPDLTLNRLEAVVKQVGGRVRVVAHGTNGWPDAVTQKCVRAGVSKINVNKLVLDDYLIFRPMRLTCR